MEELQDRLEELSRAAVLLVATDYDGTLAPIVSDPTSATAPRDSVVALRSLAAMPQTHVAIISGRALVDLAEHMREAESAHLVGSHGSEFESGFVTPLLPEGEQRLQEIEQHALRVAEQIPGAMVERKPASVTFHFRNADAQQAAAGVGELLQFAARHADVQVRHGKEIVELGVVKTDKGHALNLLRQRLGATAVIYLGDDVTDEDAFATLAGPDAGVKVGEGPTLAKHRLAGALDVARVLASLAEKRSAWLAGSHATPIEHHSMLSDQRTCALVDPRGRVTWLCLPRLDSPALFAELLGGPSAGYFEVCPVADTGGNPRQAYAGASFVLRTDWGSVQVIDYLDCSAGRPFQRAGRTDLLRVIEGQGRVRITFAPRIDFGSVETRLRISDTGLAIEGMIDPCVLLAPGIRWSLQDDGHHQVAVAEIDIGGGPVVLEMRYGTASLAPTRVPEAARRQQSGDFWSHWAATLSLPALQPDLVLRSALALRGLCYGPTGAIAAAATTSLPEHAGGVRNWDYRFCWPRDAAMAAAALLRLGNAGPAIKLLDWLLGILEGGEPNALIRPVYTITGGHLGQEAVIAELAGYRGSRPVRIGNVAAHQIQLDVLGPISELLSLLARHGASLTPEHWRLTQAMVSAVASRWREADHGIWEIRTARQHHVHSKVMCWKTVDSALEVADYLSHPRSDWVKLRQNIADDVLANGWDAGQKAFCRSYGSAEIDAAALCVGLTGLLPPDDARFASTVDAVERELRVGPTVYRYKYDDGLPGIEGGFNICTAWLIEAYALLGRWHDAEKLFDHYVALAGPTGLIAEEYDPIGRLALGNFPQAYSHIGLINTALRLSADRPAGSHAVGPKSSEPLPG